MKTCLFLAALCLLFFCGCRKEILSENLSTSPAASSFKEYLILKGQHYATENNLKPLELTEQKFIVKFDSSAVYQTENPENQYDINKLYGFSDNNEQHQQYSARFGWRWSDGALHLFAYTYNNGVRDSKELATIPIGSEVVCSIKADAELYQFSVNGKVETMLRTSKTKNAKGYQLYPYFGGDETAPHEVRVWIKEVQ